MGKKTNEYKQTWSTGPSVFDCLLYRLIKITTVPRWSRSSRLLHESKLINTRQTDVCKLWKLYRYTHQVKSLKLMYVPIHSLVIVFVKPVIAKESSSENGTIKSSHRNDSWKCRYTKDWDKRTNASDGTTFQKKNKKTQHVCDNRW